MERFAVVNNMRICIQFRANDGYGIHGHINQCVYIMIQYAY